MKKNRRSSTQTLMTIAVFGLVITGVAFFISSFFIDVFHGVSLQLSLLGVLRGILIVGGILFMVKTFQRVPMSIVAPLSMFIMFPMLLLSWLFFGDTITWLGGVLLVIMFAACLLLVFVQSRHTKKINDKKAEVERIKNEKTETKVVQSEKESVDPNSEQVLAPTKDQEKTEQKTRKSFWFGMLFLGIALSCFSASQVITRILADSEVHEFTIVFWNSLVIFVVVLVIFAIIRQNPVKTFIQNMKNPIHIGIGLTDSAWLFLYLPLVANMNLGFLNAMGRISVALTTLLGVLIFKEKIPWTAYPLIAIVIAAGVVVGFVNV
ncbi:MAG: DMT family transporter [Firmicutes bacterium]|nr:DMT family transporter [Bacillota bacterium]